MLERHHYIITLVQNGKETSFEYYDDPFRCEGAIADHLEFMRRTKIFDRISAKLLNGIYHKDWYYDSIEEDKFENEEDY